MEYETLLAESDSLGLTVKEKPLKYNDGRLKGKKIAIRKDITTNIEKTCVLAEEMGHYHTTVGNILNQSYVNNRKQEYLARLWAYNKMIGLHDIINSFNRGCHSRYDVAEFLGVTEEFLTETLFCYKSKYGIYTVVDNYIIYFEPSLGVLELV